MAKKQFKAGGQEKRSIEKYFEEIGVFNPLRPEEEMELTRRVRRGDTFALDKLVKANLRFVISVAKQYQGKGLPIEDLVSEGNLGLIKAAQRFDETRGFKFISYAVWWIRQSILQALAEQTRMVRLPMNRVSDVHKVSKVLGKLQARFGREPSLRELAEDMNIEESDVADVLKTSAQHLSLDQPLKQEDGNSLIDVVENDRADSPDDSLMRESLKEEINKILFTLKYREAEIIRLSFGLVGERPLTLEEIGAHFKLTRERIRQIEAKVHEKLRRNGKILRLKTVVE